MQYTLILCVLVQSVVGLEKGDPIYWEPGKLKLRLQHTFSKQALAVSYCLVRSLSNEFDVCKLLYQECVPELDIFFTAECLIQELYRVTSSCIKLITTTTRVAFGSRL